MLYVFFFEGFGKESVWLDIFSVCESDVISVVG